MHAAAVVKLSVLYVTRMAELAITVWSWLQGQCLREKYPGIARGPGDKSQLCHFLVL